jgi:predicted HicB family RNase H-like nuclease
MSTTVSYRGYDGSIIHDAGDSVYHGRILGIRDFVLYHGDTPEEAEQIFHQAVDEFLEDCKQRDRQPPKPFASFPVNLPHDLQVKAALYAHQHQVELDQVLRMALSQFLERAA